jgi:hypothetical protein
MHIRSPDLAVYAIICDSILSVFNLEAIRHHCHGSETDLAPTWSDAVVRIGARLASLSGSGFFIRQLPSIIQCSSLSATNEVNGPVLCLFHFICIQIIAAVQTLSSHLLLPVRPTGDIYARLKSFFTLVMSIALHPRGRYE